MTYRVVWRRPIMHAGERRQPGAPVEIDIPQALLNRLLQAGQIGVQVVDPASAEGGGALNGPTLRKRRTSRKKPIDEDPFAIEGS